MRKIILGLMLSALAFGAGAEAVLQLVFETGSGEKIAFDAAGLEMTVNGDKLVVKTGDKSQSLTLSVLTKMYFSGEESGIENITADESLEVYDLGGKSVGKFSTMTDAKEALSQGVYIAKSGSSTIKFQVK